MESAIWPEWRLRAEAYSLNDADKMRKSNILNIAQTEGCGSHMMTI